MDPHRGNGNLFLLAATFLSLTSKKNFGLALLSLKSVLGKKLCLHYDQIGTARYTWVWITYQTVK